MYEPADKLVGFLDQSGGDKKEVARPGFEPAIMIVSGVICVYRGS